MRCRGFTFIELIVTLGIVGMLAVIAVPSAELLVQRTKEQELRRALREIRNAIDAYKRASDEGRVARSAGASGYPPTLEILVDGVDDAKDAKKRKIYFLRALPRDPTYAEPETEPGRTWNKRSYASPPDAPAEGEDVFDVRSKSVRIGINGIPYDKW